MSLFNYHTPKNIMVNLLGDYYNISSRASYVQFLCKGIGGSTLFSSYALLLLFIACHIIVSVIGMLPQGNTPMTLPLRHLTSCIHVTIICSDWCCINYCRLSVPHNKCMLLLYCCKQSTYVSACVQGWCMHAAQWVYWKYAWLMLCH